MWLSIRFAIAQPNFWPIDRSLRDGKSHPPFSRVSAPHAVGRSRMQAPSRNGLVLARNRSVWLSAIGKSLKAEYDAAATPLPGHLAAVVNQLETQDQG